MNIERGPRKQRGFLIIDNALTQNALLSFGARGLAAYLLSLPPGSRVDVRSLAAGNPEGRQAIAGYMNELEAAFYLVRIRRQGDRGRFVTSCTMYEEPQDPASLPESLPKPWSKAKKVDGPRLAVVPTSAPDPEFSQVGPNPAPPDFGGPGPGRPGPGEAGDNPYGVKEPGESTSPLPPGAEDSESTVADVGGGGGDSQPEDERATAFVDALPYRGRIPGPKQRRRLALLASDAFAAGWSEYALKKQLTADTDNAKSMSAVYAYRMAPENLPDAPAQVTAPRATVVPPPAAETVPANELFRQQRAAMRGN